MRAPIVVAVACLSLVSITSGRDAIAAGGVDSSSPSGDEGLTALQEIVVTATKRAESIRDVPMSITAFNGAELAEMGAQNFDDYAVKVPGLGFSSPGPAGYRGTGPVVNIRGIGGTGAEPTTGYYIDETPIPSENLKLVDIERIEVLEGPQGTLYGARSYGGLIKVITNKARTDAFDANASITPSVTERGKENWDLSGMVNVPLTEQLAVRAVGYYVDNSGYLDSVPITNAVGGVDLARIIKHANDEKTWGGRLSLLWKPSEFFNAQFNGLHENQAIGNVMMQDTWLADNYGIRGALQGQLEPSRNEISNYNLTLNFQPGWVDVTSSTSYFKMDTFDIEDRSAFGNIFMGLATDPKVLNPAIQRLIAAGALPPGTAIATPLPIRDFFSVGGNTTRTVTEDFTQEIRLLSKQAGPLQWLLGGFYQDRRNPTRFAGEIPGIIAAGTLQLDVPGAGLVPLPLFSSDKLINRLVVRNTQERGAFGELNYTFAERWKATVGLRWFDTRVQQGQTDLSTSLFVPTILPPTSFSIAQSGVNPKFALSYRPTDAVLTYASATKGFRIGGVTDTTAATPSAGCETVLQQMGHTRGDGIPYGSDTLWTYELGAKTAWAGGKLVLDGTLFYNNWSNLQQGIFVPACGINIYQNAGKAFSKGIELQMAALLTEGVTAGVGADYLKSRITQSDVFGLPVGTPFTLAPKYKVAADLTYRRPLPLADGRWSLFGRADFSYQDKTQFDFNNNIGSVQPAYQALNLRLGLMSQRLDLVAFADNVTDEKAVLFDSSLVNGFPVPLGTNNRRIRPLRPPTFGLMITLRY